MRRRHTSGRNTGRRGHMSGTSRTSTRSGGRSRSEVGPWLWSRPPKLGRLPEPCDEEFVEGSALGLRPKARAADSGLHSFGGTCAGRIASQARVPILDCGAAMPGVRSIRRVAIPDATCITGTPRRAALLTLGGAPLSGALERTVTLIASVVPGSAESDAGPIEGAAPRPWWINIPPPPGASGAEQWISDHALMDP